MPSELTERDQDVLRRAVHLHRQSKASGSLTLMDMVQRAAHENYGCMQPNSSWADMDLCEMTQDRITAAFKDAADMIDSPHGFELVHGKQAVMDIAESLLDGPD